MYTWKPLQFHDRLGVCPLGQSEWKTKRPVDSGHSLFIDILTHRRRVDD